MSPDTDPDGGGPPITRLEPFTDPTMAIALRSASTPAPQQLLRSSSSSVPQDTTGALQCPNLNQVQSPSSAVLDQHSVQQAANQLHTPCAIDHRFFPHIMDAILEAAPYESLLVLRRTSWAFCDHVDGIMARHLLVGRWGEAYDKAVPARTNELNVVPLLGIFDIGVGTTSAASLDRVRRCYQQVRVVELFNSMGADSFALGPFTNSDTATARILSLGITPTDFAGVHTLKFHPLDTSEPDYHDPDGWFPLVKTFVCYTPITSTWNPDEGQEALFLVMPSLPDHTERAVISLYMCEEELYTNAVNVEPFRYPDSLREVVLIFDTRKINCLQDLFLEFMEWGTPYPFDWLDSLIDISRLGHVKYTLVDVHHLNPAFLRLDPKTGRAEVKKMLHQHIQDRLVQPENHLSGDDIKIKADAFETISCSAYKARVGNEQFKFETKFEWV